MVKEIPFIIAFVLSLVGFVLAMFALRGLPQKPDSSRILLGVGLLCGAASIAIRGLAAFTPYI